MTQPAATPPRNIRTLILVAFLVSALITAGAYFWLNRQTTEPLYVYYPEQTTFYLEVEPGEKLAQRLLTLLDQRPHRDQNVSKANPPGSDDQLSRQLAEQFHTTFYPHISLGLWPNGDKRLASLESGDSLVILPMKQEMTFPELLERFQAGANHPDANQFESKRYMGMDYYVLKETQAAFTVADQKLMMASSPDTMLWLIGALNKDQKRLTGAHVFEKPENAKYLALLPQQRSGTFLLSNTAYAEEIQRMAGSRIPASTTTQLMAFSKIVPLTIGALNIQGNQRLEADFFTPIMIASFQDKTLVKNLQAMYLNGKPMASPAAVPEDTAYLLSVRSLDKLYDLIRTHLLNKEQAQNLKGVEGTLSMVRLNLRQDVVGLLDGELALASRSSEEAPMLLLEKTDGKEGHLKKVLGLITSGIFFPVEERQQQIGEVSVTTLTMPGNKNRFSIGPLQRMMGIADAGAFESLAKVHTRHSKSLADNPTYRNLTADFPKNLSVLFYANLQKEGKTIQRSFETQVQQRAERLLPGPMTFSPQKEQELWLEAASGAFWVKSVNPDEDLVQAKLVLQLKP